MRTNELKERLALAYAAQIVEASLHVGDPGTTGANEASGGSPAYQRQPVTWTGGTVDGMVTGDELSFDVADVDVTHLGLWGTGGVFLDSQEMTETVAGQGIILVTPTYAQA